MNILFIILMSSAQPALAGSPSDQCTSINQTPPISSLTKDVQGLVEKMNPEPTYQKADPFVEAWLNNPITLKNLEKKFSSSDKSYFYKIAKEEIKNISENLKTAKFYNIKDINKIPSGGVNGEKVWREDVQEALSKINHGMSFARITDSNQALLKDVNDQDAILKVSTQISGASNAIGILYNQDKYWYPDVMSMRKKLNIKPGEVIKLAEFNKLNGSSEYARLTNGYATPEEALATLNDVP